MIDAVVALDRASGITAAAACAALGVFRAPRCNAGMPG